jgi:hypothetical protein
VGQMSSPGSYVALATVWPEFAEATSTKRLNWSFDTRWSNRSTICSELGAFAALLACEAIIFLLAKPVSCGFDHLVNAAASPFQEKKLCSV